MLETLAYAAAVSDCSVETNVSHQYAGYRFRSDDLAIGIARDGLRAAGYEPYGTLSGGAADANVLNEAGLPCVNLANGMADIHTPDEHIAVTDLEAMVEVTLGLVEAARSAG
jgi:tripeptide aminopeptidase